MCIRDRGYGAQQAQGHQLQHRFFSRRKGRKVCILEISGRDYCVVVGYFLIVDDRMRITGNGCLLYTSLFCKEGAFIACRFCKLHIGGKLATLQKLPDTLCGALPGLSLIHISLRCPR